jgi:hypothetical protein
VTAPFELHERPDLDEPVLVVMLQGWIDAGIAAATAMAVLDTQLSARTIATFDPDTFIDYRARRPVMELRDGVNTRLVWPEVVLKYGRDTAGQDVLLLTGHEPDSQWRLFCRSMGELAVDLGARIVVGLGAYPFGTPHTRPSRLSITAATEEVSASLPYLRNSVDVPAGIEAALEETFARLQVPAVGLWAQVPHYVANMPYPPAAVSLLTGLHDTAGIVTDSTALVDESSTLRSRLDELVAANPEHVTMLHQLEAAFDASVDETPDVARTDLGPLPTGDELAAELERFLREQGK